MLSNAFTGKNDRPANVFCASYPRRVPIFVAHALAGHTIALEPTDDQLYTLHFHDFVLGKVDTETNAFL